MQLRGLFAKIFGGNKEPPPSATQYTLLNTNQTYYSPWTGYAYDVSIVRAAVDAFARRAAKIRPRHIRRGVGTFSDVNSKYNRLLRTKPNPYTTSYKFFYRLATQYKIYNNAFIYPVWDKRTGELEALYNVNAYSIQLVNIDGELFVKMRFTSGNVYTAAYTDLIHIGRHFNDNDIFGECNKPISPVLGTAEAFNESMSKFAKLIAVVRGILKVHASTKAEDLNARRDDFVRDNLHSESNGAGVIVTDSKYEYTPISDKQVPIPTGQLEYIKSEIYDYYGVNDAIVQNKESPEQADAFYSGELEPFFDQCAQAFTNALFSDRELGCGNEIVFEGEPLQHAKLSDKTAALKFLADLGAVSLDNVLLAYNMPPIGGEEGARRVQTLNMVNAARADEYQLGGTNNSGEEGKSNNDSNKEPGQTVQELPDDVGTSE